MKVYGTIKMGVTMDVDIDAYGDCIIAANYQLNELIANMDVLQIKDISGNAYYLDVHTLEINWEDVFDDLTC